MVLVTPRHELVRSIGDDALQVLTCRYPRDADSGRHAAALAEHLEAEEQRLHALNEGLNRVKRSSSYGTVIERVPRRIDVDRLRARVERDAGRRTPGAADAARQRAQPPRPGAARGVHPRGCPAEQIQGDQS